MKKLILLRGIPGSGKSTKAKLFNAIGIEHYEADMFFMIDGVYVFDPGKIKQAHDWCKESTRRTLTRGVDVVVSNTFTQLWEIEDYIKIAKDTVSQLVVLRTDNIVKGDNGHNVPKEAIQKMLDRFEDFPGETLV